MTTTAAPVARLVDHGFCTTVAGHPPLRITAPTCYVLHKPAPLAVRHDPTPGDKGGPEKEKGQFYTKPRLARRYYQTFLRYFDAAKFQMVEPSAGFGAFLQLLPIGSFGCDIEPMGPGMYTADFLTVEFESARHIACIGNPPFGRNCKLAVRFFNRAATFSEVIAFIVPRTFRKTGIINDLDDRFHLIHEELVPDRAFLFRGRDRSVPTLFQMWVRREDRRVPLPDIKTHPDFEFGPREGADLVIQRIGQNAGRVHHDTERSDQAHYFIKGDVEDDMRKLERAFAKVAKNTAGKPSLAKSEIVTIYSERIACRRRKPKGR